MNRIVAAVCLAILSVPGLASHRDAPFQGSASERRVPTTSMPHGNDGNATSIESPAAPTRLADGGSGDGASHRYGGRGPNWWEVPCGLPCFKVWELESGGLDSLAVGAENLRRVRTVEEMRALIAKAWAEIERRKER